MKLENAFWQHASSACTSDSFTMQIGDRVSLRLYKDCRPIYLEAAPLQKGLVLLLDGKELIEEGVGFGVPVVKYKDKTYFSGSSKTWVRTDENHCTLVKSFSLDTISRKRVGSGSYLSDDLYHFLNGAFQIGYLNHRGLARISNRLMELRKTLRIQTEFIRVKPRGNVTVEYSFFPDEIQTFIEFSLRELDQCKEILILNEQGSSFFKRYFDSSGLELFDWKIGPWQRVEADEASFSDAAQSFTFSLKRHYPFSFYRGWEKTKKRFSWAGFAYSLPPRNSIFCYSIRFSLGK